MELPLKRKLFYFFPVLLCFCLPFGSLILSFIIVAWTLCSFFVLESNQFIQGLKKPMLWLCYLFFFGTVVSALLSENKGEMVFSVEVKMSFLLFPYLLFCFRWPPEILKRCVVSFVSGCFFASLYLILRAVLYALNGQPEYFFYTNFSDFIHASYFSMYLVLAIVFVLLLYPRWFTEQKSVIYSSYFFVAIFIASIFLCQSKMGTISLFVITPLLLAYLLLPHLSKKVLWTGMIVFLLAGAVCLVFLPSLFPRFASLKISSLSNVDKTSLESTAVRLLIWEQCSNLVRENFWLGTGVGDANDELYRAYHQNGLTGAYSHHLNAHNQYFQTWIGMGVFGFILLLSLTVFQAIRGLFQRKILLLLFSVLVTLNFLVESMLQSSAGVIFFAFFLCFISFNDQKQLADNARMDL